MSLDSELAPALARPRPGVVKALGILHIVFSTMLLIALVISALWIIAVMRIGPAQAGPGVGVNAGTAGQSYGVSMFGMNEPSFVRFTILDAITGIALNLAMMASGIGLLNLRGWGAKLWFWVGLTKIVRLVALWGFAYILIVSPALSEAMARSIMASIPAGAKRAPSLGELTRVYAIMNLIMAASIVALGSIYPAVTIWLLGRPGIKASLVESPPKRQVGP